MTKQITPLRQRMLDDMALRNMSPATQRGYINAVKNFSEPGKPSSQTGKNTTWE
jgi:integrase/recombinase XerD